MASRVRHWTTRVLSLFTQTPDGFLRLSPRILAVGMMLTFLESAAAAPPAPYRVIDPGTAVGTSPAAMSNTGHITGSYFPLNAPRRGFLLESGVFSSIGTLGDISQGSAVNDAGVVVGYSVDSQGRQRAIRVEDGVMSDIGTLPHGVHANGNDINNIGWVVGMSQVRVGNEMLQRAALWRNGAVIDLGTFGGEYSEATAVNDAGLVVGWAWHPFPARNQHAFLWSDATGLIDLGTFGGGTSTATDVNDRGAVVGVSSTAQGAGHAFVWTAETGMQDLGVPAGAFDSTAAAINNAGQIVGYSFFAAECRSEALLWQNGSLQLLNDFIDARSGWTIDSAVDINDRGEILAVARNEGSQYRVVLLVPTAPRVISADLP